MSRTLEILRYIINAYFAIFSLIFPKKNQKIWLIGGHNAKLYTDNAKVFYEYILKYHPEINIYWIIDKNAPAFSKIKGQKCLKGSIKSYRYFYQAEVVLFSDTLNSDIAPFSFILPIVKGFYSNVFKVYLSHGTIAFKKMPQYKGKMKALKDAIFYSYDLAIASTILSQKAMLGYNIKPSAIVLAGSARHDTLLHLHKTKKVILITPTWREWIKTQKEFKESSFFHHYKLLLSNENLLLYLRTHKITIHFYVHHLFHSYWKEFIDLENDVIKILSPSSNIVDEIASAKMMITDYSSMCSDFYYLEKPVLFFQFDKKRFLRDIGSEIDLEKDTFGEVFYDSPTLIKGIIKTFNTGNTLSNRQKKGEKYFIHFKDKQNCMRIYDAISKRIS